MGLQILVLEKLNTQNKTEKLNYHRMLNLLLNCTIMIVLKECARFTLFLYLCDFNQSCEQTFKVFQQVCNENHIKKTYLKKCIYSFSFDFPHA